MYGKIYEQTFTGSMVGTGSHVFAVWSYVIANTKPDSLVELNPVLLAAALGETLEKVNEAILVLCTADPQSRSKSHRGKRLIPKGQFIYFVPQYTRFRAFPNDTERKAYFAKKQRERRQRLKEVCQTGMSNPVKHAYANANAEADAKASSNRVPENRSLREELMDSLTELLPSHEMAKNGGLWRQRINDCPQAVAFAIEDYKVRTPDQRNTIRSLPAWLTDRHKRAFKQLNP